MSIIESAFKQKCWRNNKQDIVLSQSDLNCTISVYLVIVSRRTMKKTAYLSDIDLSTLHKKRLDEKNHYKLSWYNRRFYDNDPMSMKPEEQNVKSKVGSCTSKTTTKANANNVVQMNAKATASSSSSPPSIVNATNDGNNDIARDAAVNKSATNNQITNGNRNRSPDFYDEGYFSSPTPNRRRSGTWP